MQHSTMEANPSPDRLAEAIAFVAEGLIERDAQARCLVLAALCGEHVLFVGPPGTAKSELARRLHDIVGGRYFERLLTRFTVPEELFGPLSLAALDEGRYERDIDGYLPTATIAFLDEVFKANSAILNALLTLLNEREFDQGVSRMKTPLASVVAASNEVPEEESLRAFFDRFLFRCGVTPVSDAAFSSLLARVDRPPGKAPRLGLAELQAAQAAGDHVRVPESIRDALIELRGFLRERAIEVSDRRWVRVVRALRIAAACNARDEVRLEDLYLLQHLVSERADQASTVEDWFAALLGAAQPVSPERLSRVVDAFEKQVDLEASATELAFDDSGKLAMVQKVGGVEAETMTDASPRMSAFSRRRRYSATHVRARIAQIDEVLAEVDAFVREGERHGAGTVERLASNLWIPPSFVERIAGTLEGNRQRVVEQRNRLAQARAAFASLPLTEDDDGREPAPVEVAA